MYKKVSGSAVVFLILYIDDILIGENDVKYVKKVKEWLSSNFEMTDMGEVAYLLGVKILRDRSKKLLSLLQEAYIKRVLE